MNPEASRTRPETKENPFTSEDVLAILQQRRWLEDRPAEAQLAWCARAAELLGAQAANFAELDDLLGLVFEYEPEKLLARADNHAVLSRYAARDVVRGLALRVINGGMLTPGRFSEIVASLKESLELRGRELFHPLRLALAGRAGEGDLDRVILLLDQAAEAGFSTRVKSCSERMIEFCAALG